LKDVESKFIPLTMQQNRDKIEALVANHSSDFVADHEYYMRWWKFFPSRKIGCMVIANFS